MTDNARRTGPAVEAHYRLIAWLNETVEHVPRSQKFLLATASRRWRSTCSTPRRGHLHARPARPPARANLGQKLRFLVRLAFDRRHLARAAKSMPPAFV